MSHRRRRPALAVAWLLAAAVLSGCGDGGEADRVVLVTYSAYELPDAAADFTEETGIEIEVVRIDDAGSALNQVILTAGEPAGDVFFGVDNTFLTQAQDSEAFAAYEPAGLGDVPGELRLDDTGRFTPVDESSVCVDYDTRWFAERDLAPPAGLDDLVDEAYRDLLVVQNPALSSPGLAFLAATHATFGAGTGTWWEQLRENGVAVAASWDDAWYSRYTGSGGDRPLVVSYSSSPPAEVIFSEDGLTEPITGVLTETCFRQVEFAALLEGAEHPDAGRRLLDAMLTEDWQAGLPLSNFVFPARSGVELPPEFDRWAVRPDDPITLAPEQIGDQRSAWIDEWRRIME